MPEVKAAGDSIPKAMPQIKPQPVKKAVTSAVPSELQATAQAKQAALYAAHGPWSRLGPPTRPAGPPPTKKVKVEPAGQRSELFLLATGDLE